MISCKMPYKNMIAIQWYENAHVVSTTTLSREENYVNKRMCALDSTIVMYPTNIFNI